MSPSKHNFTLFPSNCPAFPFYWLSLICPQLNFFIFVTHFSLNMLSLFFAHISQLIQFVYKTNPVAGLPLLGEMSIIHLFRCYWESMNCSILLKTSHSWIYKYLLRTHYHLITVLCIEDIAVYETHKFLSSHGLGAENHCVNCIIWWTKVFVLSSMLCYVFIFAVVACALVSYLINHC